MDSSLYKTVTTRRSFKYNYYLSAPTSGKPFLLFLHGFPSTSYDWRYQVDFFKEQGYGLIVPDMLGYGGTDKPTEPADYRSRLMAEDIVDIFDAENVDKAIAIGHDCRFINFFPDRFTGFAFLAVGYMPPSDLKFEDMSAQILKIAGYELSGYWRFLTADGAPELIEKNIDSFYSLLLAEDVGLWVNHIGAIGGLQAWVEGNRKTKIVTFIPEKEVEKQKEELLKGGLAGPVNWYKVQMSNLDTEDSKKIVPENLLIHKPVFFGAALKDLVALTPMQKDIMTQVTKGPLTIKDFDAAHWLLWEEKEKVNQELLKWVQGL
ncbi:hypothetical protein H0H87_008076 [Tephrocybe sp. NHM501043]|nr:hypothetical protein H0H87_008076 [Tephrocybe sp. NHM501043]